MSALDLDAQVRRSDPDRWLASRFVADPGLRADLIALYAFNAELARAPVVASQPLIGQMRLAWWREALDEIFEGRRVRGHPAAQALAEAVGRRGLSRAPLEGLVEARMRDLDGWPLEPDEVFAYIDATAGRLMALAATLLDAAASPLDVRSAARAWGLSGLARIGGRLPSAWTAREIARQVEKARRAARAETRRLPVAAFPAVAYASLAGRDGLEPFRRLRLVWASLTGRI